MTACVEKIDTYPGMGRALIEHDPLSFNFPARGAVMQAGLPRKNKTWRRYGVYDQGMTSSCVGQTFKGILNTLPHTSLVASAVRSKYDAYDFYHNGQLYDQWPGQEPDYYGTSALGVAKYLQKSGRILEYRWCFGVDDVIDTLVQHGPVGIGVGWRARMMVTDADGFISASGQEVGGHEVELHGVNIKGEYVIGTNSWGKEWGVKGRFKLRWADLDLLLRAQGDAITVTKLP